MVRWIRIQQIYFSKHGLLKKKKRGALSVFMLQELRNTHCLNQIFK